MSTKVDVLRKTDDQSGLSLRAQRKNRAHQHLAKKHKVDRYLKQDKDKIETEYYFENGLRKVYPYYFGFSSFVKGRWVGRTLEDVYMQEFKGNSRKCLMDQIERGRITVNGKKVPPGFKLRNGQFVEHVVHRHENPVVGGPLEIIDNTPDLVVVNKPASIPVHPCSRYRYNSITSILRVEHGYKNLRTLYRLDRLTSGVLILPKTLKKSQRWEKQLENRQLYKEYVCRVEGEFPEGTITCDEPIDILSQDIFLFKVGPKGRPSTTTFTRLSYNGKSSVVKCVPLTGRSHQIRVHLQYLGYPILNDPIYNRAVYGKNKGKGGEVEASIEEIAADIRSGTNVGRWKGGENPRYAKFMAQKQNSKIEVSATNTEPCDNGNGIGDVSVNDRVGQDLVAKHTERSDISDSQTDVEMKDKATEEHCNTTNTSTNPQGTVMETVPDKNTDKSSVCCDSNTSDSNQGSQGSICDVQSNESKDSQLNSDNLVSNSKEITDEIPCKRRKTEQDDPLQASDSLSSEVKDCATNQDQDNSVQEQSSTMKCEQSSSMKCDDTSSTQNTQTITEQSGVQDSQSDINTSSDMKVDPVRSESPSIILYENQQFDESKMTYEENCDECMYIYKDPTPADLVLYLHAVRYKPNPLTEILDPPLYLDRILEEKAILKKKKLKTTLDSFLKDVQWIKTAAANVKKTNSTKLTDVTSSGSMNETEENMVEREDDEYDDDGSRGESNGAGFGLQYNMRGQAANVKKTNSTKLTDVTSSGSMNETEENMVEREDDEYDDDGSRGESNGAGFGLQYNMRGQAANVKKTNSIKLTDVTSSGSVNETEENMVEREDDEYDDDGSRGESNGAGFGLQYNMRGQGDADVNTTADVNTADAEVIHADCDVSFYSNDDLSLSEGQEYRPGSSSEDGSDSSDSYESPKFPMLTKCGKLNDSNMTVNEASPQKNPRKSDADESSSSVDDVDCRDVSEDLDLDNDAVSSKDNIRKVYSLSEDEIVRDKNLKNVYIRKLLNSNISKFGKPKKHETVWNQAHYCTFCCKIVTNFTKHLKLKHKKEKLVEEVVNMGNILGKRHKQVMGKWNSIKSKMDHENNIRVLKEEKGEMVLARRKGGIFDVSRYGPCPNCCIWLRLDKTLLQHQSSCPESTTHYGTGREMRIASLMKAGRLNVNASDALKNEVFTIMTPDEVGKVALSDSLIIMLGNIWMAKNFGNKLKRKYYTSSRMRDAARLLINLRELSGQNLDMLKFIEPEFFDMFVKAALKTSSPQMDDYEDLESPSTAIKLGYDLKRLTNSKLGIAIKEDNAEERKKSLDFLKLMEMEWSLKVTRLASITLQQRRFNKDRQLPNPDDIVQISKTVKLESKKLEEKMGKPDAACFRRGVMLAQTRLLLFNKRRAGEIEGISIKQYLSRKSGITDLDKAMRSDLTDVELKLLETQEVLETRGKYGRGVPVIIPRDSSSLLRYLAKASVRREAGIKDENHYLFPNTNVGVIRSYDSLKSLCSEMNLKSPEHITSVNLRKYTATLSQVLDLSSQEQSWLVNHLGHSLDIHKIHYRQTASTIERIDISKMMILQEFNLTSKYAGKQLKDIDLKELMIDSDGHVTQKDQIDDDDNGGPIVTPFIDLDADSGEGYIPEMQYRVLDKDEYEFDDEDLEPAEKKKKRGNSNTNRVMWTKEEIEEIKVLFREELEAGITPGMRKIETAKAKSRKNNGSLHLRHWEKIKKKIWNTIQKNK